MITAEIAIDTRVTPNGSGATDAELEAEGYCEFCGDTPGCSVCLPPSIAPPQRYRVGEIVYVGTVYRYARMLIVGSRFLPKWTDDDEGNPVRVASEHEYLCHYANDETSEWGWCKESECWPLDPAGRDTAVSEFDDGSKIHVTTKASNLYTAITGVMQIDGKDNWSDPNRFTMLKDAAGKTIYFPSVAAATAALRKLGYAEKETMPF